MPNDVTPGNNSGKNHDLSEIKSEVSSTISAGVNLTRENGAKPKLLKYKISITGHKDKIALAKEEIANLFVVDLKVIDKRITYL